MGKVWAIRKKDKGTGNENSDDCVIEQSSYSTERKENNEIKRKGEDRMRRRRKGQTKKERNGWAAS